MARENQSAKFSPLGEPDPDRLERRLFNVFWIVFVATVLSLFWLALRADSPPTIRSVLDVLMQSALGIAVAVLAFRALMLFPFRTPDLFLMVLVLSVAMKLALTVLQRFSAVGLIHHGFADGDHLGELFLTCLITGSILIGGGAFALRMCHKLSIERPAPRALAITAGMLFLPAAAGTVAFGLLILMEVLKPKPDYSNSPLFAVLWIGSIVLTVVNIINFGRMLMLRAEISSRERLAGKG